MFALKAIPTLGTFAADRAPSPAAALEELGFVFCGRPSSSPHGDGSGQFPRPGQPNSSVRTTPARRADRQPTAIGPWKEFESDRTTTAPEYPGDREGPLLGSAPMAEQRSTPIPNGDRRHPRRRSWPTSQHTLTIDRAECCTATPADRASPGRCCHRRQVPTG